MGGAGAYLTFILLSPSTRERVRTVEGAGGAEAVAPQP